MKYLYLFNLLLSLGVATIAFVNGNIPAGLGLLSAFFAWSTCFIWETGRE